MPLCRCCRTERLKLATLRGKSKNARRRLIAEEVSFSEVPENLRSDLANRYLADPELAITQIAWLLGYRDVGAFSHAFKRWTGKTPGQARSEHTH